jgi:hypothetical protein
MATLDGNAVLGVATHVQMKPHANAQQIAEFFGVDGVFTLFGGSRGRTFLIDGVLVADNIGDLNALEVALLSYADGNTHTLVDDRGRVWPNVIFRGEYEPIAAGPKPLPNGWCLPYKCVMTGLT